MFTYIKPSLYPGWNVYGEGLDSRKSNCMTSPINRLRPRQKLANDTLKYTCTFPQWNVWISITIWVKFGPSWHWLSIGSGNGLATDRHQAITWTNAESVSTGPKLHSNCNRNSNISLRKCTCVFECVICKFLSWPQSVNRGRHAVRLSGIQTLTIYISSRIQGWLNICKHLVQR